MVICVDNMLNHNKYLSKYACKDSEAIYLNDYKKDFRTSFFRDIDRIIYSLSFVRYSDKTQVFSFKENDHLTKRMLHVIYVTKIARTIGRALGLNEDLIEAAALGHDLGHTPFGHVGEEILNEISLNNNEGYFNHNIHSVRLLMYIENYGNGQNISLQTLDAIMCHNGEFACQKYIPMKKDIKIFIIFCIVLLYLVAIAVCNVVSFLSENKLSGFNPLPAFSKEYFAPTMVFYTVALIFTITIAKQHNITI